MVKLLKETDTYADMNGNANANADTYDAGVMCRHKCVQSFNTLAFIHCEKHLNPKWLTRHRKRYNALAPYHSSY